MSGEAGGPPGKVMALPEGVPRRDELDAFMAALLAQVPAGMVTTPGRLARAMGDSGASRYVGSRLKALSDRAPVHRVVLSTGEVRGDARRLREEGVPVCDGRVPEPEGVLFEGFEPACSGPLRELRGLQDRMARLVRTVWEGDLPRRVAGVDVSYDVKRDRGFACCAVMDSRGEGLGEVAVVEGEPPFPYIPGYLGFREAPLMAAAVESLGSRPDVVLVDGHGILHPRSFGLACHLGVLLDVPTVGCAKRKLIGDVCKEGGRGEPGGSVPVCLEGDIRGWLFPGGRGSGGLWVSPGHGVGVRECRTIVGPHLLHGRMPEPVRQAHIISGRASRGGTNMP